MLALVVELWDTTQHLSIFCIQIAASGLALYQISDETFEMINSSTDPCGPGTLLAVLTLAYCNVITIKLYIDQGGPGGSGGDQNHINPSTVHSVIHYYCISWIRSS